MKMTKKRGVVSLLVLAVFMATLVYTALVGWGKSGAGATRNIILGLDLAGGVSITYQAVEENPTKEQMADTVYKLQRRVEQYSTEASVYQEGDNRISIEIPGVMDANAVLEELGSPGSLQFVDESGLVVLDGTQIATAAAATRADSMGNTQYIVELKMTEEGAVAFAEATRNNVGRTITIIYDGVVISSPMVNGAIEGGEAIIDGMTSFEEAEELASTIRIGALQLELQEIRSNVVGAQLGEEAVYTSLIAGAVGLGLVFLLMCFLYLLPGFAAGLALLMYTAMLLVLANALNITLTLPGIAGLALSIGMAVDSNVIIFARVKEEIAEGKQVKTSLNTGFKKALSAIIDTNTTTMIAAMVLWARGTGSIKGFAQTLTLGIILSVFSSLVIARVLINSFYAIGLQDIKLYAKKLKVREPIGFVKMFKKSFGVLIGVILIGFVWMGIQTAKGNGTFNYSMEFMGGTSTNVTFLEDFTIQEIDADIIPVIRDAIGDTAVQAQKVQDTKEVIFKTGTLDLAQRESFNQAMEEQFDVEVGLISSENISSTVSGEMRRDAIISVLIATACMLFYIWFRFRDIRFATAAVVALICDVLVVAVFYGFSRIAVGNTFIAVMLTILGYSINATIVIFDRIREELAERKKKDSLEQLVDRSITLTLTRSIYTSLNSFLTMASLFIFGVAAIKEFSAPMLVGVTSGMFSSVFITGALWFVLRTRFAKK